MTREKSSQQARFATATRGAPPETETCSADSRGSTLDTRDERSEPGRECVAPAAGGRPIGRGRSVLTMLSPALIPSFYFFRFTPDTNTQPGARPLRLVALD